MTQKIIDRLKDLDDDGLKGFLDWITEHKIYTIVLIILITMGAGRIIKHFKN